MESQYAFILITNFGSDTILKSSYEDCLKAMREFDETKYKEDHPYTIIEDLNIVPVMDNNDCKSIMIVALISLSISIIALIIALISNNLI